MKFTFYDAFAGIGGIRLGMEKAGFRCVGACEINKSARHTYGANFCHEPDDLDIRKVKALPSGTDVLCGGFPCQPFSNIGKRKGFKDPNGNLFFELARLLSISKPKACLFENVKGLLSLDKGKSFATVIDTLRSLGYYPHWETLNAKDFGLPQKRERVFIIAFLDDLPFTFPNPHVPEKHLSSIMLKRVGAEYDASRAALVRYLKKLRSRGPYKGGRFLPALHQPSDVGNTLVTAGDRLLVFDCGTIRKLIPREWARMQGFPDSFIFPESNTQTYRQLGNAVPVPVVTALAKQMATTMERKMKC